MGPVVYLVTDPVGAGVQQDHEPAILIPRVLLKDRQEDSGEGGVVSGVTQVMVKAQGQIDHFL